MMGAVVAAALITAVVLVARDEIICVREGRGDHTGKACAAGAKC